MSDWIKNLFVEHSNLFLKLLDYRWGRTEELVDGMMKVLKDFGIVSGSLLDLCCGNGRISIYMAKKGFRAVGVDISKAFIEDAKRKAKEYKVSDLTTFLEGDVRNLKTIVGGGLQPFDVVVSAWTSVGYHSPKDDLKVFRQAREFSREGAILFIAETGHSEYISLRFAPTSFMELEDMVVLESRKYDPIKSEITTSWAFYDKRGEDLRFIDRVEFRLHVYSYSELCGLLVEAGWEAVALYGSLATLQPKSPLSHMNIVAKAK